MSDVWIQFYATYKITQYKKKNGKNASPRDSVRKVIHVCKTLQLPRYV
jgi:hypothetical protein